MAKSSVNRWVQTKISTIMIVRFDMAQVVNQRVFSYTARFAMAIV
jgi:hypothetical protein